jgi:Cdc6-like AAA superfamily ATPase
MKDSGHRPVYDEFVSLAADFYQKLDPLAPPANKELEGLYVDWQSALDSDDIKVRALGALGLSGTTPTRLLLTGHRGSGKSTELSRISTKLEAGSTGRQFMVVTLQTEDLNDLELTAEEVVLQIAAAVATRLDVIGFESPALATRSFFRRALEAVRESITLDQIEVGLPLVKITGRINQSPNARELFRRQLRSDTLRLVDLVNEEILKPGKKFLRDRNISDIVVVVDQLDRLPWRRDNTGWSNHDELFIGQADQFLAVNCHLILVLPIEFAYSRHRNLLQNVWGTEVMSLPVIPIRLRNGKPSLEARKLLIEMLDRRAIAAGLKLADAINLTELNDLIDSSGGHPRSLMIHLRGALQRSQGNLPVSAASVKKTIITAASDMNRTMRPQDRSLLDEIRTTGERPINFEGDALFELLQNLFVLSYTDEAGEWYRVHPLLDEKLQ